MAQDDTKPAIGSGTDGGTGGTGPTEAVREGGDVADRGEDEREGGSLAGDDSADEAIGGGATVAATGGPPALSGRATREGGASEPSPPDPGHPGDRKSTRLNSS